MACLSMNSNLWEAYFEHPRLFPRNAWSSDARWWRCRRVRWLCPAGNQLTWIHRNMTNPHQFLHTRRIRGIRDPFWKNKRMMSPYHLRMRFLRACLMIHLGSLYPLPRTPHPILRVPHITISSDASFFLPSASRPASAASPVYPRPPPPLAQVSLSEIFSFMSTERAEDPPSVPAGDLSGRAHALVAALQEDSQGEGPNRRHMCLTHQEILARVARWLLQEHFHPPAERDMMLRGGGGPADPIILLDKSRSLASISGDR